MRSNPVKVWSKSVVIEGHFTRELETVFRLYLAWHSSGVAQTYLEALTHALQPVNIWSKLMRNKGRVTRE
jgi:hypothetical protein